MANTRSISNATALRDENVLRRVRHLGSARDGLAEWRLQRRTALALIPLGLYFVASMLRLATSNQLTAAAWLASPVPALLTILFVLALLAHASSACARSSSITCTRGPGWSPPSCWCALLQWCLQAPACSPCSSFFSVDREANNAQQLRYYRPF